MNSETTEGSVSWAIRRGEAGSVQAYRLTLAASTRPGTEIHHAFTLR